MTEKHKDKPTDSSAQQPGSTHAAAFAQWVLNTPLQEAEAEFEQVTGRKISDLPHLSFLGDEQATAATPYAQRAVGERAAPARPRRRKRWSLSAAAATSLTPAPNRAGLKLIEGANVAVGKHACAFYSDGKVAFIGGLPAAMNGRYLVCNGRRLAMEWLPEREMHRVVGLTFSALDRAIEALEAGDRSALAVD